MPSDNKAAERFSATMLNRAFVQNPVLVGALGLCPIAGGAVSLQAGLVLSGAFTTGMMLNMLAAHFVLKKLPRWLRMPAYVLIALAAVCPAGYILETRAQTLLSSVGIYLALMAVSSLISLRSEKTFVACTLKRSFSVAAAECAGYAAVIMAVSFIRELLGSGTLWGVPLTKVYFAPGLLLPFGGFLALGFLAALHRGYIARHFALRGALKDITFDLSAAAGPLITPAADIPERKQAPPAPAAEKPPETPVTQPADETDGQEDTQASDTVPVPGEAPAGEINGNENEPEDATSDTQAQQPGGFAVTPFIQAADTDGETADETPAQERGDAALEDEETPDEKAQTLPADGGEIEAFTDEKSDEAAPGEPEAQPASKDREGGEAP